MDYMKAIDEDDRNFSELSCPARETATPSTSSNSSCDDQSEGFRNLITCLSKQLRLQENSTLADLNNAIVKCKELIYESDQCSSERNWLVKFLVELRLRVQELKDAPDGPTNMNYSIMGHQLQPNSDINLSKAKQFCDHCTGVIWKVVQGSYVCKDCNYMCHVKCVENINRVCAHILTSVKGIEMTICPEKGLASQGYKCAECKVSLTLNGSWNESRLCDYSGEYFCSACHWNNTIEIPARIVHNWDWEKRPVSQAAYQLLLMTRNQPLINLENVNEKIFSFVAELDLVRKMRGDLSLMRRYLVACSKGKDLVNVDMLYLAETTKLYSIAFLEMSKNDLFESLLSNLTEICREHIMNCQTCYGKGYICELCKKKEVIFPFDAGSYGCNKCNSYFHRACWIKHQICRKCTRMEKKSIPAIKYL